MARGVFKSMNIPFTGSITDRGTRVRYPLRLTNGSLSLDPSDGSISG